MRLLMNLPDDFHCDLMVHSRWIIPIIPEDIIHENCTLLVSDGDIVAIVPTEEAKRRYRAKEIIDLPQHVVMPGLINAHGHAAMSLFRGYADDLTLQTWLNDHIWPAEGKHVSADFVRAGTQLAVAEMIRSGTTCFSDMYFFPDEVAGVAHGAGIRCQIAFPILEFPSAWAKNADDYINKGLNLHDEYRSHPLIQVNFGTHAPYTVSDDSFRRIAIISAEMQACIQVHLHETEKEVEDAKELDGRRPIRRLYELDVITPLTQCVHMTTLEDEDIEILQKSGAHVVHCPESNLKLASGLCPVARLLDAGVNVALGTDSCASNNDLDMFGEMHTAALLGKAVAKDASVLNAHQVLRIATINGARALNIDEQTGSLEVGKSADFIALALDPMDQSPLYNLASQLIYTHNGQRVTHSWVKGKALLRDRELETLNASDIINQTNEWQRRISG